MQTIAYAAILAVILPISVMTWLAFTGDRAGLRNIQSNLGTTSQRRRIHPHAPMSSSQH